MTSSTSAKLKLDTLASSFTGTEGAGVDDGGGVIIGASTQLMAHRATAIYSDSATGVLFIFFVFRCFQLMIDLLILLSSSLSEMKVNTFWS